MLKTIRDWVATQGVPVAAASEFIGGTYVGLAKDAFAVCESPTGFDELIAEQTPGGLNERAIKSVDEGGMGAAYKFSLASTLAVLECRPETAPSRRSPGFTLAIVASASLAVGTLVGMTVGRRLGY